MKLTKKHIGRLFDCRDSDGRWCYLLVDIDKHNLLFYSMGGRYEIMPDHYNDWRPFKPHPFSKSWVSYGWQTARVNA